MGHAEQPPDGPAVDDAPRMLTRGEELLEPVGAEAAVQVKGATRESQGGDHDEEDAETLRNTAHIHSGEADEDAQKPCDEQHEVLRCEP